MHDDLRLSGRCRRQQFCGVPPLRGRADAHAALCFRAYRECGPHALPGARALQYRFRPGRHGGKSRGRECRPRAGGQSAHVRERDRKKWARAAKAGDRGLREGRHGAKVMCHIGGVETRELMSQILDMLRPGDILTHAHSGAPNIGGAFTNIVQDGRLLPAALAAKQRGVIFDVRHGGGSFDYTVAEPAIAQGCPPDTISSDIHVFSGNTPGMPYLPWVMSKFMGLGFTLEQVVAMATSNPAKVINRAAKLGTLQVGAPGDVAIDRKSTRLNSSHMSISYAVF